MASVIMPSSWMPCRVQMATRSAITSYAWVKKMSVSLCLVGGMYLSGASGKQRRTSMACDSSSSSVSARYGSISYEWPRPSCQSLRPARLAKHSLMNWLAMTVCAAS